MNITQLAPPDFDWTLMRSFLAVSDAGSLLGASRLLGISQPTLGRHVAELERQLGCALFERTGRGLVPTAVAAVVAAHARAMAGHADAIGRALAGRERQPVGSVRITASQVVAVHLLPGLMAGLRARAPDIAIDIVASNGISNLLRREADIALRMVRPEQSSLIARRLGTVEIGTYAHRDYLARHGMPTQPAELLAHTLLGFDQDDQILRGFATLGVVLTRDAFALRSDDHLVLWEALKTGLGIGFAPVWLARREPALVRLLPELKIPPLPVWLAVHREIRSSARIRLVYDALAKAVPVALEGAAA